MSIRHFAGWPSEYAVPGRKIIGLLDQFEFHKKDSEERSARKESIGRFLFILGSSVTMSLLISVVFGYVPGGFAAAGFLMLLLIVVSVYIYASGITDEKYAKLSRLLRNAGRRFEVFGYLIILAFVLLFCAIFVKTYYDVTVPSFERLAILVGTGGVVLLVLYVALTVVHVPVMLSILSTNSKFSSHKFVITMQAVLLSFALAAVVAVASNGQLSAAVPMVFTAFLLVIGYHRYRVLQMTKAMAFTIQKFENIRRCSEGFIVSDGESGAKQARLEMYSAYRDLRLELALSRYTPDLSVSGYAFQVLCEVAETRLCEGAAEFYVDDGPGRRNSAFTVLGLSEMEFARGSVFVFQNLTGALNSIMSRDLSSRSCLNEITNSIAGN